jgi:hypothetical protein
MLKKIQGWINGNASTHVIWLICRPPPWRWPHQCHLRRLLDWMSAWWENLGRRSPDLQRSLPGPNGCIAACIRARPFYFWHCPAVGPTLIPGRGIRGLMPSIPCERGFGRSISFILSSVPKATRGGQARACSVQQYEVTGTEPAQFALLPPLHMSWTPVRKVGTGDDSSRFGAPRKPFTDH